MLNEAEQSQKVFQVLDQLGISYTLHRHPAVYTVEEAMKHDAGIEGLHCKNLFLRDHKGRNHILVVTENLKVIQVKEVGQKLGLGNLSFASPERLMKYLGLEPGSVSPFGLINDESKQVVLILDETLRQTELINFHPNVNTMTITLRYEDFEVFVQSTGNPCELMML
ncbi:prolyl-tRNA synthetase associated domain-containing protein [Anoxynatronum sibiricum]|uniref:Prolyl-tRNA synthetase associated domain-containing protein n=1 Tax=Anoxynatronum sibiricum TaxID=210623 RepID=A0ABU9VPQ9_9CLOT